MNSALYDSDYDMTMPEERHLARIFKVFPPAHGQAGEAR